MTLLREEASSGSPTRKDSYPREMNALDQAEVYEFSATTRTSGVKLPSGSSFAFQKMEVDESTGRCENKVQTKYADEALAEFVDYHVKPGEPPSDTIEILKGAPDSIRKIALDKTCQLRQHCRQDFNGRGNTNGNCQKP